MSRRPDFERASALRVWDGPRAIGLRRSLALALGLSLLCANFSVLGASPSGPTSSRAAREDAIRSIPLDKIDPAMREKVQSAIAGKTLFRRLPVQVIDCDPELYLFLVRHPDVIVSIWEVMKISNVAMERTGPDTFRASDNAGTNCNVKFCYSDHETEVIYVEGAYSGPLLSKPVRAKAVLLLKSGYVRETNGKYYVTSRMDTFIQIEHVGLDLIAKTLAPILHRSADYNFVETAAFVSMVSRTAEVNPPGMYRLAGRLPNLQPQIRNRFAELSLAVGDKARERQQGLPASAVGPLSQSPLGISPESQLAGER